MQAKLKSRASRARRRRFGAVEEAGIRRGLSACEGEGMTTIIMRVRSLGQAAHWMSHLGSGRMAQAPAGALRRASRVKV
jgi:hypothetical protein